MERASAEHKPFNVTEDIKKELELLQKRVDQAFENRVPLGLKAILQRGNLEQPNEVGNGVSVKNPHLYPHLVRMAYQKIGLKGTKLQGAVKDTVEHETQHFVPLAGSPNLHIRFGVRFYKVARFPFISFCQAEIFHQGRLTLAEDLDFTTNVKQLSSSDKADLKHILQALNAAKKLPLSTG